MMIVFGALVFCALMLGMCGSVIIPAGSKLTSSTLCPADTRESVVVVTTTRSGRGGGSSTTSTLYCIDSEGGGTKVGGFKVFLLLTGYAAAALGGLFVIWVIGYRLTKKSPGGRA